jgi:hypothetical protein
MTLIHFISDAATPVDNLTSFGAAGLMGAMWLWERRTSQKRESQLDDAHGRILGDQVKLEELIDVVRQNAEAISRLCTTQDQLLRQLGREPDNQEGKS